ncbi:30S ribosomal protein S20 [Candidatus Wolfebacteria bacterium]|nr:30S ribosomal protein S20 [Candidatus Wolfebacteria bacterium]
MAITEGAKKAHRASLRKRVFNIRRWRTLKSEIKGTQDLIATGDLKAAAEKLPAAYKAIDKAEKRGLIKKRNASRKKSQLARAIGRKEEK